MLGNLIDKFLRLFCKPKPSDFGTMGMDLMFQKDSYLPIAKKHEVVFRNILQDMISGEGKRPARSYIPSDLQLDLPLEYFYKKYSEGNRYGIFTIKKFLVSEDGKKAGIAFEDVAVMSGGGASYFYEVHKDKSVTYVPGIGMSFRS